MWEHKRRYRGKGVARQIALRQIESTGTLYVDALIECTHGPEATQEIRYRGFVNNEKNASQTIAELRAMGWTGTEFGKWQGFGSTEFSFVAMGDKADDGKTYFRATFVQELRSIADSNVTERDTVGLTTRYAALLQRPARERTNGAAPPPSEPPEYQQADDFPPDA